MDLDHYSKDAPPTKLISARSRLAGAAEAGVLNVKDVWLYPSGTELHYHMIVRLNHQLRSELRNAYELYLRDDVFRNMNNKVRIQRGVIASLLITSEVYPGFYREPDHTCACKAKHSKEVMEKCPIANLLRGDDRTADYFGKPKSPKGPISFGKIEV